MRTLEDIADKLEQAQNALVLMAQSLVEPSQRDKAGARLYTEEGEEIDLRALASDLRHHAGKSQSG